MWDRERGEHFINTVQNHFRLYEGTNFAGKLVELMPYQVEFFMRLFCWVVWSDFYGRYVRRFRRASLWVPKKNGKSPTGAMVGNYLTTADGEVGGKTFAVAKDGKQARIVHDHAVKMVEQSSDLLADCKITLNPERRITHLPSLSWFGVLSADNIEGQEGLNGNAIIDEGHVVVERLARVLKFMGASREEPIELMLSTAGDNKAGWGGKRWDYGQRVNKGEVRDTEFLHVCYAAPQDATDAQLLRPRMWRKANPALGHILDEERFAQELETARSGSMQEWSDFKKYRFNIWQTSTSPWLSMSAWDECPT
ncbi:MAG: terminase TerL endonuclease subunit, partial [Planctomycetota bacterium]